MKKVPKILVPYARKNFANEEELEKGIQQRSFAKEIELDKALTEFLLQEVESFRITKPENYDLADNEKESYEYVAAKEYDRELPQSNRIIGIGGVLKRTLALCCSGDMQVTSPDGRRKPAAENGLPAISYLTHGGEIEVEIPANSGHKLINWLAEENSESKDLLSQTHSSYKALQESYEKGVGMYKHGKEYNAKINTADKIHAYLEKSNNKREVTHLGLNINFPLRKRSTEFESEFGDGQAGYIHYKYTPPTEKKPGILKISSQDTSPYWGNNPRISITEGSNLEDLHKKKQVAPQAEYKDTIIPKSKGGMKIVLDEKKLDEVTNLKEKDFDETLAGRLPAKNVQDFRSKISNGQLHRKVNFTKAAKEEKIILDRIYGHGKSVKKEKRSKKSDVLLP